MPPHFFFYSWHLLPTVTLFPPQTTTPQPRLEEFSNATVPRVNELQTCLSLSLLTGHLPTSFLAHTKDGPCPKPL